MGNFRRVVGGKEFTWVVQAAPTQGIMRVFQVPAPAIWYYLLIPQLTQWLSRRGTDTALSWLETGVQKNAQDIQILHVHLQDAFFSGAHNTATGADPKTTILVIISASFQSSRTSHVLFTFKNYRAFSNHRVSP